MFSNCRTLDFVWNVLDNSLESINFTFRFVWSRSLGNYHLRGISIKKSEEILVMYLNSIVNYKILKFNLKIQYEDFIFEKKKFITSLIKTLEFRRKIQESERVRYNQKLDNLETIISSVKQFDTSNVR